MQCTPYSDHHWIVGELRIKLTRRLLSSNETVHHKVCKKIYVATVRKVEVRDFLFVKIKQATGSGERIS